MAKKIPAAKKAARRPQAARSLGKQKAHLCSICNKPGHRQETCQAAGAARVRALEKLLCTVKSSTRAAARRPKEKVVPSTSGVYRKKASMAYSGIGNTDTQQRRKHATTSGKDRERESIYH